MIILCSTDDKVLERWRNSLENLHDLSVCAEHEQLSGQIRQFQEAIVLLHMNFPQMDSPVAIAALIQANPSIRVIACSDNPDDNQGLEVLKAGVYGYCNTWIAAQQLERVIEQVMAGEAWVGRSLILRLIRDLATDSQPENVAAGHDVLAGLSEREREVAKLVGEGHSNKQIASVLDITERTVKAHLSSVFLKTGCKDRVQLALLISQAQHQPFSKLGS